MFGILLGLAAAGSFLGTLYWKPDLLFSCFSACYPKLQLLNKISDKSRVILTIDDVPRTNLPMLLFILKKYQVTATFFVISSQVTDENRPYLIQALQEGHHLANHGATDTMHALHSTEKIAEEIEKCRQLIRELYLEAERPLPPIQYYRPGCGFPSKEIENHLAGHGMRMVLGSVYPYDPQIRIKKINLWYLEKNTKGGDIVIIHDLPDTPEILDKFLNTLHQKNLIVSSLEEYDRLLEDEKRKLNEASLAVSTMMDQ